MFKWFRNSTAKNRAPDWVVVFVTDNLPEAHIVSGRLDYEGIPSWVFQEPGAAAWGITVGILGEVRVLVNAHDYERAQSILQHDAAPPELEATTDDIRLIFPEEGESPEDDLS
jgi:hypothetical protein